MVSSRSRPSVVGGVVCLFAHVHQVRDAHLVDGTLHGNPARSRQEHFEMRWEAVCGP